MIHRTSPTPNSSIALIIAAAVGSSLFTLGAGALVYRSTNHVITAARWVQHSQEVLNSLQSSSQWIDRVEASSRLFASTSNEDYLNTARSGVLRLEATTTHLRVEVEDNQQQTANANALQQCAATLSTGVDQLAARQVIPNDQIFHCRQTMNEMSEQEKKLLENRVEQAQSNSTASLTTDVIFAGLSFIILSILFTFLLRDAYQRRRIARKTQRVNRELAMSVRALEDRAEESNLLTAARDELQLCISREQVYSSAVRSIPLLVPGTRGTLGIIDNSRHQVESVAHWGTEQAGSPASMEIFAPSSCCGLRSGSLRWRRTGLSEIHCTHFAGNAAPDSYLCIPMVAYGETIGILFIDLPTQDLASCVERRLEALRQLIQLISMSIASMQVRMKLENQSIRDPLTGLFNRYFMQMTLQKELARGGRKRNTLGLLMLDVDHFKTFNDRFGHAVGDTVLENVASVLQASVRTDDFVCRFGGEEFLIILPETCVDQALECAETIRRLVSRLKITSDGMACPGITISGGLAFSFEDGADATNLIERADRALYEAKRGGRDRIVLHELPTLSLFAGVGVESEQDQA